MLVGNWQLTINNWRLTNYQLSKCLEQSSTLIAFYNKISTNNIVNKLFYYLFSANRQLLQNRQTNKHFAKNILSFILSAHWHNNPTVKTQSTKYFHFHFYFHQLTIIKLLPLAQPLGKKIFSLSIICCHLSSSVKQHFQ